MGVTAHKQVFINALLGTVVKLMHARRTAMRRPSARLARKTVLRLGRCLAQVIVLFYGRTAESRRQQRLREHGKDVGGRL